MKEWNKLAQSFSGVEYQKAWVSRGINTWSVPWPATADPILIIIYMIMSCWELSWRLAEKRFRTMFININNNMLSNELKNIDCMVIWIEKSMLSAKTIQYTLGIINRQPIKKGTKLSLVIILFGTEGRLGFDCGGSCLGGKDSCWNDQFQLPRLVGSVFRSEAKGKRKGTN